jgi:hypothetical protein
LECEESGRSAFGDAIETQIRRAYPSLPWHGDKTMPFFSMLLLMTLLAGQVTPPPIPGTEWARGLSTLQLMVRLDGSKGQIRILPKSMNGGGYLEFANAKCTILFFTSVRPDGVDVIDSVIATSSAGRPSEDTEQATCFATMGILK